MVLYVYCPPTILVDTNVHATKTIVGHPPTFSPQSYSFRFEYTDLVTRLSNLAIKFMDTLNFFGDPVSHFE